MNKQQNFAARTFPTPTIGLLYEKPATIRIEEHGDTFFTAQLSFIPFHMRLFLRDMLEPQFYQDRVIYHPGHFNHAAPVHYVLKNSRAGDICMHRQ